MSNDKFLKLCKETIVNYFNKELYLDAYKKWENKAISVEEER